MDQKSTYHRVVCFGETLWDILPNQKFPGGAPMNVAYHLNRLGKPPAIISRIGNDDLGKELMQVFRSVNIDTGYFQVDPVHATGNVFATIGEHNEVSYDIVKPVAWDFITWDDDFTHLIENAEFFVFGSLVTRNEPSCNTLFQCIEAARKKVLDINLRPPHYNQKIVSELLQKANILKLNLAELNLIAGWFGHYSSEEDRINLLKEKFNIDMVIVTKGDRGALFHNGSRFFTHPGYQVRVSDTVGSGDSFLAAMLSGFIDRAPPEAALDFASAMGAFIASCSGGCPPYDIEQVIALMENNKDQKFSLQTNS